jgi:hypothetical protein
MLTRDQLLGIRLPETEIEMPEFGGSIRLRGLTAGAALKYFEALGSKSKVDGIASLITASVIDDAGELVFQETDAAQIAASWPNAALQRVAFAVMELNGVDTEKNLSEIDGDALPLG